LHLDRSDAVHLDVEAAVPGRHGGAPVTQIVSPWRTTVEVGALSLSSQVASGSTRMI